MLEAVSPRRQSSDWREGNPDNNNQHEAEKHEDLEGMNVSLPREPMRGFQIEANAPLTSFHPQIDYCSEEPIDIKSQVNVTNLHTAQRIQSKAEKLKSFQKQVSQRMTERAKQDRHKKTLSDQLVDQVHQKLLAKASLQPLKHQSPIKIKKQPQMMKSADEELIAGNRTGKSPRQSKQKFHRTGKEPAVEKKMKSPLFQRNQHIRKAKSIIRSELMACKSFPEENGMMEMKGQQKQHPRFRDSSSDSNGIHSFTSAQRAQLVATVRRSYMEIERARLQKQLPSALVMKSSSSSTLRSRKSNTAPENNRHPLPSTTGSFTVDVTYGEKIMVKKASTSTIYQQNGQKSPQKNNRRVAASPLKETKQMKTKQTHDRYISALQLELTTPKSSGKITSGNNSSSKKKKLPTTAALCGCSSNSNWVDCANNCDLYQNPEHVQRLLISSVKQKQPQKFIHDH